MGSEKWQYHSQWGWKIGSQGPRNSELKRYKIAESVSGSYNWGQTSTVEVISYMEEKDTIIREVELKR